MIIIIIITMILIMIINWLSIISYYYNYIIPL